MALSWSLLYQICRGLIFRVSLASFGSNFHHNTAMGGADLRTMKFWLHFFSQCAPSFNTENKKLVALSRT